LKPPDMIEELLPNLFCIRVPLPRSPLKYLNSYFIRNSERSLLIDTGMNREECLDAMTSGLARLGGDLTRTDLFITHFHADHAGLAGKLATETSAVYFNRPEADILSRPGGLHEAQDRFYLSAGFPEDELRKAIENHPGRRYQLRNKIDFKPVGEGDFLDYGDFRFRVMETPGHTPGHLCLYEDGKQVLVCGDLILFDITPNITYWSVMENSLKSYLNCLDRVYPMEVKLLLPGHRSLIHDHRKRIEELRRHHRKRLDETLAALADGEKDTYHVAPYLTWDITARTWEEFPPTQKWFAFGETMAHLVYLEKEGAVRRINRDGRITFALSN